MSKFVHISNFKDPEDCKWSSRFRNMHLDTMWKAWKIRGLTLIMSDDDEILGAIDTDEELLSMTERYNWDVEKDLVVSRDENVYGLEKLYLGDFAFNVFEGVEIGMVQFEKGRRVSVFDGRSIAQSNN